MPALPAPPDTSDHCFIDDQPDESVVLIHDGYERYFVERLGSRKVQVLGNRDHAAHFLVCGNSSEVLAVAPRSHCEIGGREGSLLPDALQVFVFVMHFAIDPVSAGLRVIPDVDSELQSTAR